MGVFDIGGNKIANGGIESRLDWVRQDLLVIHNTRVAEHAELLAEMKKQTAILERIARQNGGRA